MRAAINNKLALAKRGQHTSAPQQNELSIPAGMRHERRAISTVHNRIVLRVPHPTVHNRIVQNGRYPLSLDLTHASPTWFDWQRLLGAYSPAEGCGKKGAVRTEFRSRGRELRSLEDDMKKEEVRCGCCCDESVE